MYYCYSSSVCKDIVGRAGGLVFDAGKHTVRVLDTQLLISVMFWGCRWDRVLVRDLDQERLGMRLGTGGWLLVQVGHLVQD